MNLPDLGLRDFKRSHPKGSSGGGSSVPSWVPLQTNLPDFAINWMTNQVWQNGVGGLITPAAFGIATIRNSTVGLVADASGNWSACAANTTRQSVLGRLTEEPRTNIQVQSNPTTINGWTLGGATLNMGVSSPASPMLDSTTTQVVEDTSTGVHQLNAPTGALVSGTNYTASMFVRSGGGAHSQFVRLTFTNGAATSGLFAEFDIVNGVVSTAATLIGTGTVTQPAQITQYANGWSRISITGTVGAFTASALVLGMESAVGTGSYTGDGSSSVYAWGAQIEAGSHASSPIPTLLTSIARLNDKTAMTVAPGSAYTIYEQGIPLTPLTSVNNQIALSINDGTGNNRAQTSRIATTGLSTAFSISGGVAEYNNSGPAWQQNAVGKLASAVQVNASIRSGCFNGTLMAAAAIAAMPVAPTTLEFGSSPGPALFWNGLALIDAVWLNAALSQADLTTLTT